jgi:antitoxin MazE
MMRASVRKLGNSAGVIIPKSILTELGLTAGAAVDMALADGRLILVPVRQPSRAGWAEASRDIAEAGDDALAWPEFANSDDDALVW